ncbi:CBS domain-containing protein [uncultured Desulfosarcina sp.]|uniref:CBS domain-containing protein n=1 Tax=uncultured Desulfosarcina sp. TaxID=218289 RepID=UPI0029C6B326|nr:CBS domain-containing protein [uncultured Desulfosarcina sp.]
MTTATTRNVLSGMRVREAMRRQIVSMTGTASIATGVGRMIKYKADALLVTEAGGVPTGIVAKTDMVGAYYAGLPVDTPLEAIMVAPLQTCFLDDGLDHSLDSMRSSGIHQLFVVGAHADRYEGMLNYGDILGLVFKICRSCRKSRSRQPADTSDVPAPAESTVAEVMTPRVIDSCMNDTLFAVIEALTSHRMSAVLVTEESGRPTGVISKTDLIMAWRHGIAPDADAASVMNRPVISCDRTDSVNQAMTTMLLGDMSRIFVHDTDPHRIVGVLSLSDAANHRSGTCRACVSSRMVT